MEGLSCDAGSGSLWCAYCVAFTTFLRTWYVVNPAGLPQPLMPVFTPADNRIVYTFGFPLGAAKGTGLVSGWLWSDTGWPGVTALLVTNFALLLAVLLLVNARSRRLAKAVAISLAANSLLWATLLHWEFYAFYLEIGRIGLGNVVVGLLWLLAFVLPLYASIGASVLALIAQVVMKWPSAGGQTG